METYSIIDLEGYATSIREAAAKSFTETYTENLDEFISINQIIGLVEENSIGTDEDGHYLITEENFEELFDKIKDRLYNVGLSRLAAKGFIECAWDDKENEMVFWLSESGEERLKSRSINNDE